MTNAVPIYEAKNKLPLFIHQVENEGPVIFSRHNKDVAVLISLEDYNALVKKANSVSFMEKAKAFRERNKDIFTNQEIDEIFNSARNSSEKGTSWEDSVFDGVL